MNRIVFLKELEQMLMDISDNERQEALQYYKDYLDDAGVENEEEAIKSLGSPEKVARNIKAGLSGNDRGAFTETGYQEEPPTYQYVEPKKDASSKNSYDTGKWGWIILAIICSPVLFIIAITVLALLFSLVMVAFSVVLVVFLLAFAGVVTGVASIGFGIGNFYLNPMGGLVLISLGAISIGIGLICVAGTVWGFKILIPMVLSLWNTFWNFIVRKKERSEHQYE